MQNSAPLTRLMLGLLLLGLGCTPPRDHSIPHKDQGKPKGSSAPATTPVDEQMTSPADPRKIEAEKEEVVMPTQVSGVYLHCIVNDSELQTSNRGAVDCLVKDSAESRKASLANLYSSASFFYQRPEDSAITVTAGLAPETSPYHVSFQFSAPISLPLGRSVLDNFLVMFRASPLMAAPEAAFFSAKLGKDGALSNLPENFAIYYAEGAVINQPAPGFTKRILPTVNRSYSPVDGCYLACYSMQEAGSVYPVGTNVYVMGQFRTKGLYEGRLCRPQGYAADVDLAADLKLRKLCTQYLPTCAGDRCWAGPDTGGWYGL